LQLSHLNALKEQEEKQLEQVDEMMYTYARDNERKVKYKYTYSYEQNSLVASELARHEKNSTASHSSFFSPIPLSPVSLSISISPIPFSPPLSPTLIKRSSRTMNNDSQTSGENVQRRRLQIIPSPPPPELIHKQTLTRRNRNTDDRVHLTTVSRLSQTSSTTNSVTAENETVE
jgi:hypothetical protein